MGPVPFPQHPCKAGLSVPGHQEEEGAERSPPPCQPQSWYPLRCLYRDAAVRVSFFQVGSCWQETPESVEETGVQNWGPQKRRDEQPVLAAGHPDGCSFPLLHSAPPDFRGSEKGTGAEMFGVDSRSLPSDPKQPPAEQRLLRDGGRGLFAPQKFLFPKSVPAPGKTQASQRPSEMAKGQGWSWQRPPGSPGCRQGSCQTVAGEGGNVWFLAQK